MQARARVPHFLRSMPALAVLLAGGAALTACNGGGGGGGGDSGPRNVSIQFQAKSGNTAVACGTPVAALGTGAIQSDVRDMRFYVSDVKLIDKNGNAVPVALTDNAYQNPAGVSLIDLENATGACAGGTPGTNDVVAGSVPAGEYTGISFTVGVPVALNHSDYATAAKPLDIQAMAWSWQAGRKFMKVEVNPVGGLDNQGTPASTFNFHLGSTGCTGNPATGEVVNCSAPNRLHYSFAAFNADTQKIVLDIQQLFLQSNLSVNLGGAVGCMSGKTDPECPPMFGQVALDIDTGLMANAGQQVFRVESK